MWYTAQATTLGRPDTSPACVSQATPSWEGVAPRGYVMWYGEAWPRSHTVFRPGNEAGIVPSADRHYAISIIWAERWCLHMMK